MSVRLVAKVHPFDATRRIVRDLPRAPLAELFSSLELDLDLSHARFTVNDGQVADPAFIPADGDLIFVNVVPAGDTRKMGTESKIGGALMVVAGVLLTVFTAGIGAGIGAALIGSGVSLFLGGVVLYNTKLPGLSSQDQAQSANYLRGSQNQTVLGGPVSIVLGKHRIAPDNAAAPYTEIVGNDQYLHQLFAVSTLDCAIDADTWKIGDTLLSKYDDASVEIVQDGATLDQYPYIVRETSVGQEVRNQSDDGSSGSLVFTTATKTNRIVVDVAFNGLIEYDKDGNKQNASVELRAEYKPAGADDSQYRSLGHWVGGWDVISAQSTKALRFTITKDLDNLSSGGADYTTDCQYDVRLTRVTGDSSDSSTIDKVYWGSLRAVQFDRPISEKAQAQITVAALRIKATGQLSGTVSQLSCIAHLLARNWDSSGSGADHWPAARTANPASAYLYILTNPRANPRPTQDSAIDWPAFESWHQFCSDKDYECNMVVSDQYDRDTLLDLIAQCGRATGIKINGKYSIVVDRERDVPMQMITPRNSWGYSGSKAFPDFPHALKINFIDAALDYQQSQLVVYDDGYNEDGSGGKTVATSFQEVDTKGVTSSDQAWKIGRYRIAAAHLRCESHELTLDFEYLVATIGDRVLFAHDVILVGLAYGRIVSTVVAEGLVTGLVVDEELQFEDGKSYAVSIRTTLGIITCPVTAPVGIVKEVALVNPISETYGIAVENLYTFGEAGLVTEDVIISDISPAEDLTAKLTLVDYASEIFDLIDDPNLQIPPYDPKISKSGSRAAFPVISSLYDIESALRDAREAALSPPGVPTYGELQGGYDAGGGTTIPATVDLSASGGYRSVTLVMDRQPELTNFQDYELQVAADMAGPWYSLRQDGLDWKGDLNAYTIAPVEMFAHVNIPLAGTADAPLARSLWYRARRVTKVMLRSSWSSAVQGVASPTQTGDLAAGSVTTNKLAAGILETLQAVIQGDVIIDKDIGFLSGQTGEVEGNEQAYLNETEVAFRRYWGGMWHTMVRLALEGLYAQQHYSDGPLVISNGTNATRRARGFDLGRPYPSANSRVYHFDGDVSDQLGTSGWTIQGSYAFDEDDLAILAMAPFTVDGAAIVGGMSLTMALGAELFGDWWIDLWFQVPAVGDNFDIVSIGNAANGVKLHYFETAIPYIDPGSTGQIPYTDPGDSGQLVYVVTEADTNLSIISSSSGVSRSQRRLISRAGWLHVGFGYVQAADILHVALGLEDIQFGTFNIGGSDALTVTLNEDKLAGMKFDEVLYDLTMPITVSTVLAQTNERIPWAANDYSQRTLVLEAYDPDVQLLQNLVRSADTADGYWTKYPDGTLEVDKIVSVTIAISTSAGVGYKTAAAVALGNWPAAAPFASLKSCEISVYHSTKLVAIASGAAVPTAASPGSVYLWSPASQASDTYSIHIQAKGRWKV